MVTKESALEFYKGIMGKVPSDILFKLTPKEFILIIDATIDSLNEHILTEETNDRD